MRAFTSAAVLSLLLASSALAASVCNGHAELCDRLYSNVTFIGAHDSYAVGSSIADNQDKDVTAQLNDGVRVLQVQTHNASDGIHLCHTSCSLLDGGLLSTYLSDVNTWMNSNPNEVVTLVMVNIDTLAPTAFASAFATAGLDKKAYSPSAASTSLRDWPSLGTIIDAGTPLVVFMDYNANFASVPWIIDEFANMFEDAYDVTSTDWSCNVNRTSGTPATQMLMVNHFLDSAYNLAGTQLLVPNKSAIKTTNAEASLDTHVSNCQMIWARVPNIILLDFYDSNGNEPFQVAANLNAVSAPTNTVTPGSASTQTSGTSPSNSGSAAAVNQQAIGGARSAVSGLSAMSVASVLGLVTGALLLLH